MAKSHLCTSCVARKGTAAHLVWVMGIAAHLVCVARKGVAAHLVGVMGKGVAAQFPHAVQDPVKICIPTLLHH